MEGRAIARPNAHFLGIDAAGEDYLQWRAGQLPGQTRLSKIADENPAIAPSMEGRAIARPNMHMTLSGPYWVCPSMEGRAIARPNAARATNHSAAEPVPSMEGRAIARPNAHGEHWGQVGRQPSMEGRAIARPNALDSHWNQPSTSSLQWRAGQLPGQTERPTVSSSAKSSLQWRAGQLPGQT